MVSKLFSIRRKSDFKRLFTNGKSVKVSSWFFIKYIKNEEKTNRYGWTLSKKIGNSVIRNRLKRWLRTYFRDKKSPSNLDINVILLPQKKSFYKELKWQDFERDMDKVWAQIIKKIK